MFTRIVARVLQLGVLVVAAAVAVVRFLALDAVSHSNSDTIRPWVIQMVPVVVVAAVLVYGIERASTRRG